MQRWRLALNCVLALTLIAASLPPRADGLGRHIVMPGETLYCIGRAYGVHPTAIAEANGLPRLARLKVGQALLIPDSPWDEVPPGPTCRRQEGVGGGGPTNPTGAVAGTGPCGSAYTVKPGDNLFRISLRCRTTVAALKSLNHLSSNLITPGQILAMPDVAPPGVGATPTPHGKNCDPAYPTVCIPSPPPDLNCPDIGHRNFTVLPPDPHRFDGDGDGIGCEQ